MDIKQNSDWHGHLQISGIAGAQTFSGSIVQMTQQIMAQLITATPRIVGQGKEITVRFTSYPLAGDKVGQTIHEKAVEVENMIDWSQIDVFVPSDPEPDDSPESYRARMEAAGHDQSEIDFAMKEIWGIENKVLKDWQDDIKIQRLIKLNASNQEYESAPKDEYSILKAYAMSKYPTMCEKMHWREA